MIYVTSDLHGYSLIKFKELLRRAGFTRADYCFILGDVIDRGEDSALMLEWLLYRQNVQLIMGNHEAMLLACRPLLREITEESIAALDTEVFEFLELWMENGGKPTADGLRKLDKQTREDIIEYLADAPLYETVTAGGRKFILTHSGIGGFSPEKELSEYDADAFLWNRPKLSDRYYEDATVILGHTPTHFIAPEYKGEILVTDTWIDIDTGASVGLSPTLLRLDDMTVFR